jgi:flagellar motor switch protein FliG
MATPSVEFKQLTPKQKAAILLVSLGEDITAPVLVHLTEEEVEDLMLEVARLGKVMPTLRQEVIEEFSELVETSQFISEGGVEHARIMLEKAFGEQKAEMLLSRVIRTMEVTPFDFIKKADGTQILPFLRDENPQTIALIAAHLSPLQAATVISGLPQDLRAEVARRVAQMDRTPPDVVKQVEKVLERKISRLLSQDYSDVGGVKALADLLQWVDRATERTILEKLTETEPELAEEVKNMMFTFEDMIKLDDRAIQQVLREVDSKELALALRTAHDEVKQKITRNMSERAAAMLKEDMEFMGPVRLRAVEEAQQRIVSVIRKLEEAGEIVLARGAQDEVIV